MNFGGAVRLNKVSIALLCGVAFLFLLYMYGGDSKSNLSSPSSTSNYGKLMKRISLRQLLIAAIDVAERGGIEVVKVRRHVTNLGEAIKGSKNSDPDRLLFPSMRIQISNLMFLICRRDTRRGKRSGNPRGLQFPSSHVLRDEKSIPRCQSDL